MNSNLERMHMVKEQWRVSCGELALFWVNPYSSPRLTNRFGQNSSTGCRGLCWLKCVNFLLLGSYESRRLLKGFRMDSRWGWVGAGFGLSSLRTSGPMDLLTLPRLLWEGPRKLPLLLPSGVGWKTSAYSPLVFGFLSWSSAFLMFQWYCGPSFPGQRILLNSGDQQQKSLVQDIFSKNSLQNKFIFIVANSEAKYEQ